MKIQGKVMAKSYDDIVSDISKHISKRGEKILTIIVELQTMQKDVYLMNLE